MLTQNDGSPAPGDALATQTQRPRQAALAVRNSLPDRNVTNETIEDAYVQFILYCNPGLGPNKDIDALRESFRNLPRSGGKAFSPFTVFELVKKFYNKDIKTWTELTVQLGVEPPNLQKDESAQKIAQYGVRLKKWMNSMHVKAFFEYLMDMQNDYWTNIPSESDPTAVPVRDGVLIEDDMALRALLPHLRPKRGRKRPEADDTPNPNHQAQRSRMSPGSAVEDYRHQEAPLMSATATATATPWSAHPDGRGPTSLHGAPNNPAAWAANDAVPTPISRWPQSAVTPTMARASFWDDNMEPRSAVTPTKSNLRRGAKNVSSAWKTGGPEGSAKKRGRPPINRTPIEPSGFSAMAPWNSLPPTSSATHTVDEPNRSVSTGPAPTPQQKGPTPPISQPQSAHSQSESTETDGRKASRPSISLQVPARPSGSVRLATPPPPAPAPSQQPIPPVATSMPSSIPIATTSSLPETTTQADRGMDKPQSSRNKTVSGTYDVIQNTTSFGFSASRPDIEEYFFEKMEDRTNIDVIMAYLVRATVDGIWTDEDGNPTEPATIEEATAIVNSTLQNMYKNAGTPQEFLINLAAFAGAMSLVTNRVKCVRQTPDEDFYRYKCEWEYRFGHVSGQFAMAANVPRSMWKGPELDATRTQFAPDVGLGSDKNGSRALSAGKWQEKYGVLLKEMETRELELRELKKQVIISLREGDRSRNERRRP